MKRAAEKIRDANDDGSDGPTLSERAKQSWEKAKVEWEKMNEQQKNTSGMPEGCFCDMRGWACPKHRGKEKWRQSHVVKIHEAYNGGDGGAASNGAASDAAAEDNTHLDELMAQLMTMGFEPERITQALTRHRDLESAIEFLLDSPEPPPPPRVPSTDMLGAPPAAPAPPPPGAPAVGDLLGDLLDLSVAPAPAAGAAAAPSLQPPPRRAARRRAADAAGSETAANSLDALLGTPQGPPPPAAAAARPSGGSGGGLSADVFAALAAPPVSVPAAVAAPLIPTPAAAPVGKPPPPSPKPAAPAAVLAAPPRRPRCNPHREALPAGWVSKVEPSNGKTYYFNAPMTRRSQLGTAGAVNAARRAPPPLRPPRRRPPAPRCGAARLRPRLELAAGRRSTTASPPPPQRVANVTDEVAARPARDRESRRQRAASAPRRTGLETSGSATAMKSRAERVAGRLCDDVGRHERGLPGSRAGAEQFRRGGRVRRARNARRSGRLHAPTRAARLATAGFGPERRRGAHRRHRELERRSNRGAGARET